MECEDLINFIFYTVFPEQNYKTREKPSALSFILLRLTGKTMLSEHNHFFSLKFDVCGSGISGIPLLFSSY